MVKDATGVACTAVIAGAISIFTHRLLAASTASTVPSTTARLTPSRIRQMDMTVIFQKAAVAISLIRHFSTCTGVGSSSGLSRVSAPRYHTAPQKRSAGKPFTV